MVPYTPPHQRGRDGSTAHSGAARSLGDVNAEGGVYLQVQCRTLSLTLRTGLMGLSICLSTYT